MADGDFRPGDPVVDRVVDALRELPAVDREAIARTVAAAGRLRADELEPNEDDLVTPMLPRRWNGGMVAIGAAAVSVLAAGISLVVVRRDQSPRIAPHAVEQSAPAPNATPIVATSAAAGLNENAPIPTQFVYDGPAHRVTLVGDFNRWDEHATPLVREPGSALWSVTLPLQRGRHVYAFIVDSTWTPDRRAPVSRDPDFGVEGSVIIVGRP